MSNALLDEAENALRQSRSVSTLSDEARWAREELTWDKVVLASVSCLAVSAAAAVPGFIFLGGNIVVYLAMLVGLFGFGIYIARKSPISPVAALTYSAVLGLVAGAFTSAATASGGALELIPQAILGTTCGGVAVVLLSATPLGKKWGSAGKFFAAAMFGYFLFGVVNIVLALLGVGDGWGIYGVGVVGVLVSLLGVAFAAWSLLTSVVSATRAVEEGAPASWSWSFGMGISSSLVWMYLEILRLLAITNR